MSSAGSRVRNGSRQSTSGQATRVLRIGLVGCGERGVGLCGSIARTNNTRLAMVMDANPALAQDLARRFNVSWSTSFDEVLSNDAVDAVIISTPHHLHAPQAIRAIDAGKHVLVEKPLATSLNDAVSIVHAARKAGVHVSIILPYRYMSRIIKAKALIEAGALGELFGVSLNFHDDKFASYWQGGHTGRSVSDWRQRWETSGGGFVIATVIHHIDWLRYLPGLDIVEVSAKYTTWDSPGAVEDTLTMWFRYENGALGTINACSCVRGTDLVEFRFWGRDGQISLTQPYQFYSLKRVDGKRPGLWHEFSDVRGIGQRDVEYLQRFSDRVLRGKTPEITGEDGLAVQAIIEAAYESSRTGQVLKVERGPW